MSEDLAYPGGLVRLFVGAALADGARVDFAEGQAHYLLNVMRARTDDRVRLFNGRDGEWLARLEAGKKRASAVCERQVAKQGDVPDLWLAFAPLKRVPADYLAQKATELGVRVLQPVITRRTIVSRVNLERLRANAVEASEQSGRTTIPEIRSPIPLARLLASWAPERKLIYCDEGGDAPPIGAALARERFSSCGFLTGPEGGFDEEERRLVRNCPFAIPVSLGTRILRADTAALAALAVFQALNGDWR